MKGYWERLPAEQRAKVFFGLWINAVVTVSTRLALLAVASRAGQRAWRQRSAGARAAVRSAAGTRGIRVAMGMVALHESIRVLLVHIIDERARAVSASVEP